MGKFNGELALMICLYILVVSCIFFNLWKGQTEILESNPEIIHTFKSLKPGWNFLSRYKDVSDIEWSSMKHSLKISWLHMLIQFAISEILRNASPRLLKYWYILSSAIYILFNSGRMHFVLILVQPIIYSIIIFYGGKTLAIWVTSILVLIGVNLLITRHYVWNILDHRNKSIEDLMLFYTCLGWVELRCISFSIDYVEKKRRNEISTTNVQIQKSNYDHFVNMLSYVLYLPMLYTGPILLYEDFEKIFTKPCEKLYKRILIFLYDMTRYITYLFMIDLYLHYIYFNAFVSDIELVKKMSVLGISAGAVYMLTHLNMKYLVSYGTAAAFTKLDNNAPPAPPCCIFLMYDQSYVWKHFDVGLYKFLVKYIYKKANIELSKYIYVSNVTSKLIAALMTFIFIYLWHGTHRNIFIWITLNYIAMLVEYIGVSISQMGAYKWFTKNVLRTATKETLFISIFGGFVLEFILVSHSYYLGGEAIGNLYFGLVLNARFTDIALLYVYKYVSFYTSYSLVKSNIVNKGINKEF